MDEEGAHPGSPTADDESGAAEPSESQAPDGSDGDEPDPHADLTQGSRTSIDPHLQGPAIPSLFDLVERPWPRGRARMAKWTIAALVILAPLTATVLTWWGLASQADREVIDHNRVLDPQRQALWVDATALTFAPDVGEMAMRLVFSPQGSLVQGDRLTSPVTVVLNDLAGRDVRTYQEGSVMEPITAIVPAQGNSARYPFDTYSGRFQIGASVGSPDGSEPLELDLSLVAALDEFSTRADLEAADNAASIDLDLSRRWASVAWVVFFMLMSWAIALGCAGIVWWVVVFHAQNPFWAYAMFASVLFALPSLRSGLPGSPRYGVLVDWAAFYWAIAIVAISLILALFVWNVTARDTLREAQRVGADSRSESPPERDP